MEERKKDNKTHKIREGISQPPNINPAIRMSRNGVGKIFSVDEYIDGIRDSNRSILSQAITLIESSLPCHHEIAQEIVEKCLPYSRKSVRIGITGVPGAGKSTFIENLGLHIVNDGRKLAVLAIDPSSEKTKGSIMGDKTRMEQLCRHPEAFIRPSPAAGTLGGVSRKTRETIILCEAAGFNTILIETVGVGQSETAVHSMVDCFLLLMLAGAGDELQGIKRGIMEMADIIAITKADGPNIIPAEIAKVTFQNALHLFPPLSSGWKPQVLTCSAKMDTGISEIWEHIQKYIKYIKETGYFKESRKHQAVIRMNDAIIETLKHSFYNHEKIRLLMPQMEQQLHDGTITSYKAARRLLDHYFKNPAE
jgi:LAO/AO transport system kinase